MPVLASHLNLKEQAEDHRFKALFCNLVLLFILGLSACAPLHPELRSGWSPPVTPYKKTGNSAPGTDTQRPASSEASGTDFQSYAGKSLSLRALDGWADEDHLAAFQAYRSGCSASKKPLEHRLCNLAGTLRNLDENKARRFFEAHFKAVPLNGQGLLTAYFMPIYPARHGRQAQFSAPILGKKSLYFAQVHQMAKADTPLEKFTSLPRSRGAVLSDVPKAEVFRDNPPQNLPDSLSDSPPVVPAALPGSVTGSIPGQGSENTPDLDPIGMILASSSVTSSIASFGESPQTQKSLQNSPDLPGFETPLQDFQSPQLGSVQSDLGAWMRPEDLVFMQIQGSAILEFPEGDRQRASYAGDNGQTFVPISRPLIAAGILTPQSASGEAIHHWLAEHEGEEADRFIRMNPRYVFFHLRPETGGSAIGAAGLSLPPGRSLAIDPSYHAYGDLFWIDARATGSSKVPRAHYQRLAMALDTGGAIRGQIRADLYIGIGRAAGEEAGRVHHHLQMVKLVPIESSLDGHFDTDSTP